MGTEEASHTVVVVSDPDFRVHLNANELINDVSYPEWRGDHHKCTFTASYQSLDEEMRKAVKQHVKDHYAIRKRKLIFTLSKEKRRQIC
jgi:hypothetical protein